MKNFLILFLICIFAFSCTTTRYIDRDIPVETVKYKYINNTTRDSIYIKDSIFTMIKQDTVLVEKWHTKYIGVIKKDTIHTVDSIPYIKTITTIKEVNNLTLIQKALNTVGIFSILSLIIYIVIKIKHD